MSSMVITCALAAVVFLLWVKNRKRSILFAAAAAVAAAAVVIGLMSCINENPEGLSFITRNEAGKGDKEISLQAQTGGRVMDVSLSVPEMPYSEEELDLRFEELEEALPGLIKGKNDSLLHVEYDLDLKTEYAGFPAAVSWYSTDLSVVDFDGRLTTGRLDKGKRIKLLYTLTLQEKVKEGFINIRVFPSSLPAASPSELLDAALIENEENKEEKYILPSKVNGYPVIWMNNRKTDAVSLSFLSVLAAAVILISEGRKNAMLERERKDELEREYPELVSSLLLYMYAGLNTRAAFFRIALDMREEEKRQENAGSLSIKEEVEKACTEMERGIPETEAYERFGKSCGIPACRTLSVLLSSNVRKGSSGIISALEAESVSAFENRKRKARQDGDTASVKLLLPMGMMLAVVLAIMIVPSLLSL